MKSFKIILVCTFLGVLGLAIYSFIYKPEQHRKVLNEGKTCTCEIIKTGHRIQYKYSYDSNEYISKEISSPYPTIDVGEQFDCFLDLKSKYVAIAYHFPVLDSNKIWLHADFLNFRIRDSSNAVSEITFEYKVNGKNIKRFQKVPSALLEREDLKVIYDSINPKIGYLLPLFE